MKKYIEKVIVKLNLVNIIAIFYYIFRIFKIKNNKVFCQNFTSGKGVGDSPKYIAMYLLNNTKNKYDIVWAVKKIDYKNVPVGIRLVKIYSFRYFYEMATSKIWISNTRFELFTRKRKNQYYIQTWHSPLRLKKIEKDAYDYLSDYYKKCMVNDSKLIDVILSGCDFSTNIYKNSFEYYGKILEIGTPRCDVFFDNIANQKKLKKIKEEYNLNEKKIMLYAPTFRKRALDNKYLMDFKLIYEKFGDNYNILVRSHPSAKIDFTPYSGIIDVSDYPDMQDLLCCADILITDYSSCCFDMLIANKPCYLLIKDVDNYLSSERDLYFKLEELPFVICRDENKLVEEINNFNIEKYNEEVFKFKEKIGLFEEGKACMKICEIIDTKCFGD